MSIHSAIACLLEILGMEIISLYVDDTALTKQLNSAGPPLSALEDQLVSLNVIYTRNYAFCFIDLLDSIQSAIIKAISIAIE